MTVGENIYLEQNLISTNWIKLATITKYFPLALITLRLNERESVKLLPIQFQED